MKLLLFGLFSLFLFSINIEEVRQLYPDATEDSTKTNILHEKLSSITQKEDNTLFCYKGAVYTLKAKHAKAIKDKKAFFKEGASIIEAALAAEPDNIELRFIRLSVQENAPKILKYRDHIEKDKNFILGRLSKLKESSVKNLIYGFVKDSKTFSEEEKLGL